MKRLLCLVGVFALLAPVTAGAAEERPAEPPGPSLEYRPPRPVLPEPKGPTPAPPVTVFQQSVGRFGISTEAFDGPVDVALDANGNVYVLDRGNNRIQIFDRYLNFVQAFGTYGSRWGEFNKPTAIALNPEGFLFVVDSGNNRVQIFVTERQTGKFVFYESCGSLGSRDGDFKNPVDVTVDGEGFVWILDAGNERVQKFRFNPRGGPRPEDPGNQRQSACGSISFVDGWGKFFGDRQGRYEDLVSVAWSDEDLGYIYLLGAGCLVQQFRPDGTFWKSWPATAPESGLCVPERIETDNENDYVYVLDSGNSLLIRFSRDGRFYSALRGAERPFARPRGFALLPDRNQFAVADTANNVVQKFTVR